MSTFGFTARKTLPTAYMRLAARMSTAWIRSGLFRRSIVAWKPSIQLLRRKMSHDMSYKIMRFMSSDRMYRLMQRPRFAVLHEWFPTVVHPDAAYRLINNYDGYVNTWADTWSEKEIFPVLQRNDVVIRDLSSWRLGIWGVKMPGFYSN